jgi:hypothetical protein
MTTTRKPPLKLFVWHDVLVDYTSGMIVVMARSREAAERALRKDARICGTVDREILLEAIAATEPEVLKVNEWACVYGGG